MTDRPTDRPARVLGDSRAQSRSLESVASAVRYHDWLTSLALPWLGEHPLELGSGLGDYARRWLAGGVPRITMVERDEDRLDVLTEAFGPDPRVTVLDLDVLDPAAPSPVAPHSSYVGVQRPRAHPRPCRGAPGRASAGPPGRACDHAGARLPVRDEPVRPHGRPRPPLHQAHPGGGVPGGRSRPASAALRERSGPAGLVRGDAPAGHDARRRTAAAGLGLGRRSGCPRVESRLRPPFGQSVFAVGVVPAPTG